MWGTGCRHGGTSSATGDKWHSVGMDLVATTFGLGRQMPTSR